MRIMFVIPRMNGGGAERVVANLANYLCGQNEVEILAVASNESFYELDKRVTFISQGRFIDRKNKIKVFASYVKYFPKAISFLRRGIRDFGPDVVVSFLVPADIMTYIATFGNHKFAKVYSERNDPTQRSFLKKGLLRIIYKSGDMLVCQGKKVHDYYSYIPKDKKVIIPNPLDIDNLPKPKAKEENCNLVAVGRFSKQKNFGFLIDSFRSSIDKIPSECNLVIYGDGPQRNELQEMVNSQGLRKRVLLPGAKKNILQEISGSAAFVMSSLYEGFPNALIEAMAMGLPVISTDFYTGIAKEMIKRENGFVVPVGDVEKMSDAIINMMNNEEKRCKFREENASVRDELKIEKIGGLWASMFAKLISKKVGGVRG